MRKLLTLIATVIMIGATLLSGSAQAASDSPFLGTWTSVDTDGSNQWLRINGGGSDNYAMFLYDDSASVCGGAPARFTGSGTADGDTLIFGGTLTCAGGGNVIRERLALEFELDSGADTLTDFSGVVWQRS
jgi:hypothetical protein